MAEISKAIRTALAKHATFTVEILPEDLQIDGNASAIDEDTDRETVADIRAQLDAGNECAWCCVVVRATWRGFTGIDSLGGCSYPNRKALEADLLPDMKHSALDDLAQRVSESHIAIAWLIKNGASS